MARMLRIILILFCVTAAAIPAKAQQFSLEQYKQYLDAHKNMSGEQVLAEHPAVLFNRTLAKKPQNVKWLDSVIIKYNLTGDEQAMLLKNGFMVSERLARPHVTAVLGDVYHSDLPVFVSSDAILHAVHMSYDDILKATEKYELYPLFLGAMQSAASQIPMMDMAYENVAAVQPMLRDVDLYITVTLKLLGENVQPFYPENAVPLADLLDLIKAEQPADVKLFSTTGRNYDFSQFTVRGHYKGDPILEKYFQAFMWMGRTEFMLSKPVQQGVPEQSDEDIQRQTIDAYLLRHAVKTSAAEQAFAKIEAYLKFLIGDCDNVTMAHLDALQSEVGFTSPLDLLNTTTLTQFQTLLAQKPYSGQRINSQILMSDPMSPEQLAPPSAFLIMGQRFILDSYIFGSLVYDKIIHDNEKVRRMLPSSMDALFALGNDAAAQFLQDELKNYYYAPYLASLRYLIDGYGDDYWQNSMYTLWLNSIRSLNPPQSVENLPEFMQTAAWWQQKMNTQLSSWAQLRHDNLLYAKQSYSGGVSCSYPEGYVEPYPELYRRLALFAQAGEQLYSTQVTATELQMAAPFFNRFAEIMTTLQGISERELNGMQLTAADVEFIQKILKSAPGCGDPIIIDGWYQDLFYSVFSVSADNYVVADVHTAPTDEAGAPVGWVKHVGTGLINTGIVIAPSIGGGLTAYTGPMMSYHEHTTLNFKRLNDDEWAQGIANRMYTRPDWTNEYLLDVNGAQRPQGPVLFTKNATPVDPTPVPGAKGIQLLPVYPNPVAAGGRALFGFNVAQASATPVTLTVYSVTGQKIATVVQQLLPKGEYFAEWNALDQAGHPITPGVYLVRLESGAGIETQNVVITQ